MIAELLVFALFQAAPTAETAPPPREVAPGVHLIAGSFYEGRGPDGNTVIIEAPDGLIVVDTGRHAWYSDAILAFAHARGAPISAIFNTHWHLDHASGNRRLRAVFPDAPVYTSNAIDRALTPEGFLGMNRNEARLQAMLDDPNTSDIQRYEILNGRATMAAPEHLRPTIALERSQRMRIAGRRLDVRVTQSAVTDADVWIYDRRTRVAVLGDLVTFPSPLFESACPNGWRRALDEVWATPFRVAIPGHGSPMTRDEFNTYRLAFGAFIDCVLSEAEAAACVSAWTEGVARFIPAEATAENARAYAEYYVGFLRNNGGKGQTCLAD